ncbi:MAG: L-ribulose-5-phosphate 3-epimerase [Candidatus Limivicinus sp.]
MKKAYSLGLYEKAMPDVSWSEKLKIAKEAGYDFVEISIDATEERISRIYSSRQERRELADLCFDLEMPIRTLNASALTRYSLGNPDPALCAHGMEIAERSIELAVDLGVRIMMIPGYDVYYEPHSEETERRFVENIRRLERIAACAGVQLGFETMENEFMNTVEKALYYVGLVNSNYLKIYPDIGNTTNAAVLYGTDPIADLRQGSGQLLALHLKETCPGCYREIPYGTGHVDFEAAVRTAWELGIRCYVTEFWYKEGGETPAEVCARFSALLDRQLVATNSEKDRKP